MILKNSIFSTIIAICWLHVCPGVISGKSTTNRPSTTATPIQFKGIQQTDSKSIAEWFIRENLYTQKPRSISNLTQIELFDYQKQKQKLLREIPSDYRGAGSDNDEQNGVVRITNHTTYLPKDRKSGTKKEEIQEGGASMKEFDLGRIRLPPCSRVNRKRRSKAGQEGDASTSSRNFFKVKSTPKRRITFENDILDRPYPPSENGKNLIDLPIFKSAAKFLNSFSRKDTNSVQETDEDEDEEIETPQRTTYFPKKSAEENWSEIIDKQRNKSSFFRDHRPEVAKPKKTSELSSPPREPASTQQTPLVKEPSPENVPLNNKNINASGLNKDYDKLTFEQISELARKSYTRYCLENNISTKFYDIESSFVNLGPKEIDLLSKAEYNNLKPKPRPESVLSQSVILNQDDDDSSDDESTDDNDFQWKQKLYKKIKLEIKQKEESPKSDPLKEEIIDTPGFYDEFDAMTYEQKTELARRRYIRLCLQKLNPYTGVGKSDMSTKFETIQNSFQFLMPVHVNFLSRTEYNSLKVEPLKIASSKNNTVTDFDRMKVWKRIEMANNRYTVMRKKNLNPFTGQYRQYFNNEDDKIEAGFYSLTPDETKLLAKFELTDPST